MWIGLELGESIKYIVKLSKLEGESGSDICDFKTCVGCVLFSFGFNDTVCCLKEMGYVVV